MAVWHGEKGRKLTGGLIKLSRKKRKRELGSLPYSHPERARARFIRDVIKREEKIEKFKKKYEVKVCPASTLEELMQKLGVQKEKKKS